MRAMFGKVLVFRAETLELEEVIVSMPEERENEEEKGEKEIVGYQFMLDVLKGYIESFNFSPKLEVNRITCFCDEEGKLKGLPIRFGFTDAIGRPIDVIAGDILFVSTMNNVTGDRTHNTGDVYCLSERQIRLIENSVKDADFRTVSKDGISEAVEGKCIRG